MSYSLYLLHWPAVYALSLRVDATGWPLVLRFVALLSAALPIVMALARMSYVVFERPYLRGRSGDVRRLAAIAATPTAPMRTQRVRAD